jgi:hypothetical protein
VLDNERIGTSVFIKQPYFFTENFIHKVLGIKKFDPLVVGKQYQIKKTGSEP